MLVAEPAEFKTDQIVLPVKLGTMWEHCLRKGYLLRDGLINVSLSRSHALKEITGRQYAHWTPETSCNRTLSPSLLSSSSRKEPMELEALGAGDRQSANLIYVKGSKDL